MNSLRKWRQERAVLRTIGVRRMLIPTSSEFQYHSPKVRTARFHERIMRDGLIEPLDYLSSCHMPRERAGLSVTVEKDFNYSIVYD
jgi:hypothetical protein